MYLYHYLKAISKVSSILLQLRNQKSNTLKPEKRPERVQTRGLEIYLSFLCIGKVSFLPLEDVIPALKAESFSKQKPT